MSIILTIISIVLSLVTILNYFHSRKIKLKIFSNLEPIDNKPTATIEVRNDAQRKYLIKSVSLPLFTWKKSEAHLKLTGIMETLRKTEYILNTKSYYDYLSLKASRTNFDSPVAMSESSLPLLVLIDLDLMMNYFIKSDESLGNKFFFALFCLLLKIEVESVTGTVKSKFAHRDIRYYLWNKYKNNTEIYKQNFELLNV